MSDEPTDDPALADALERIQAISDKRVEDAWQAALLSDQHARQAIQIAQEAEQNTRRAIQIANLERTRAEVAERALQGHDEQPTPPTDEDVIRRFYRRHARNKKIRLIDVAREMGRESRIANIRVAKVGYDKRRKRWKKG